MLSGKYYVLIPIPDAKLNKCKNENFTRKISHQDYIELQQSAESLIKRLKSKPARRVHAKPLTLSNNLLKKLKENDTLYITCHGNSQFIGTFEKGISFSPEQLALALKEANLSFELQNLKIMTCNSAITSHIDNRKSNFFPYIQKLSAELHKHGYQSLDVAGYLGEVAEIVLKKDKSSHSYAFFTNGKNKEKEKIIRANLARFWQLAEKTKKDVKKITQQNNENVCLAKKLLNNNY